jgi:hypothetical protein
MAAAMVSSNSTSPHTFLIRPTNDRNLDQNGDLEQKNAIELLRCRVYGQSHGDRTVEVRVSSLLYVFNNS